ncbi:MATE family efflux transporter [Micromonospora sp. WMMD1082]|uniref:MATE family efflux transporter n=1 Tax=Micromonospora sp. WMMD1082 TaxID=3016104 RepID=UPI0024163FB8|nr:MATE family efflux transporter [Micromonospora sp. WMMD1082]MDG4795672.1 MATE family efflux transporter [Micromonospora sp. WMMD1082]
MGPVAFAAVNTVAPVLLLVGAVATTVGAGGASLVSRSLGAGDTAQAARAAGTAFVVFWATAVTVGVAGVLLIDPLLTVLGATGPLRGYARDYAVVILAGAITATGFSSLVRAEGRMRFSTMLWVLPVLTQIILDPLLIFGFGMGVRGAAWGTVGGQAVSMGMSLWFFFGQRHRPYRIRLDDLRPHGPTLRHLVALGSPSFLAGFGAALLTALANNLLVTLGGAVALGAWALCTRIGTFVTMPQLGIAQGMQPIVGYNAGHGSTERVRRATVLTIRATIGYGTLVCAGLIVSAGPLTALFTNDPAMREQAATALRILALSFPFAGIVPLLSARFQALGQPRPSYLLSVGSILAVKAPLMIALSHIGTTGLWISVPLAELVSAAAALFLLRRSRTPVLPATPRPDARPTSGPRGVFG